MGKGPLHPDNQQPSEPEERGEVLGDDGDEDLRRFFAGEDLSAEPVADGGKGLTPDVDNDDGVLEDEEPSDAHPGVEGAETQSSWLASASEPDQDTALEAEALTALEGPQLDDVLAGRVSVEDDELEEGPA